VRNWPKRWDKGLTAAEMKQCHWVKPVMVCKVKFTEWTRDDRVRQPVFLGIREDKNANDVVRTSPIKPSGFQKEVYQWYVSAV
jgi:bifunctional non-homologous end joining protein LigD